MVDFKKTVSELTEFGLLAEINAILSDGNPEGLLLPYGDDCAAIAWPAGAVLLSSDAMVEGVHFRWDWTEPEDLAWKSLATAVSDLAAKGAEPVGALVTLGLPPDMPVDRILSLYRFWRMLDEPWGCPILGGDTVRSPVFFLDLSVFGKPFVETPISMATAQEGDQVLVTGTLGDARAGLQILEKKAGGPFDWSETDLIRRFLRPEARVAEIRRLLHAGVIPTAMTDISDGLARSVRNLCTASGVGIEIAGDRLPISRSLQEWAGLQAIRIAWQGGEDYEILLTVSKEQVGRSLEIARTMGVCLISIGEIRGEKGEIRVTDIGDPDIHAGYDHFRQEST